MSEIFCTNCGTKNGEAAVFCGNCRQKLIKPTMPPPILQQPLVPVLTQPVEPVNRQDSSISIRRSSQYTNSLRAIKIFIDQNLIGEIRDGEERSYIIQPGLHSIHAKIDFTESNAISFQIEPGQSKWFSLDSPLKGAKMLIPFIEVAAAAKKGGWIRLQELS